MRWMCSQRIYELCGRNVAVAEPHVDHREGGRGLLDLQQAVGHRHRGSDAKAAALERLGKPLQERMVVFDDQHEPFGGYFVWRRSFGGVADGHIHVTPLRCRA
jgi:hypothetical protein